MLFSIFVFYSFIVTPLISIYHKFISYYFSSSALSDIYYIFNLRESGVMGVLLIIFLLLSILWQLYAYMKKRAFEPFSWWHPERWFVYVSIFLFTFIHYKSMYLNSISGNLLGTIDKLTSNNLDSYNNLDNYNYFLIFPTLIIAYLISKAVFSWLYNPLSSLGFESVKFYIFISIVLSIPITYFFSLLPIPENYYDGVIGWVITVILYITAAILINIINFITIAVLYYYIPLLLLSMFNFPYITFSLNIALSIVYYIKTKELDFYALFSRILEAINTFDSINIPTFFAIIAFLLNLLNVAYQMFLMQQKKLSD